MFTNRTLNTIMLIVILVLVAIGAWYFWPHTATISGCPINNPGTDPAGNPITYTDGDLDPTGKWVCISEGPNGPWNWQRATTSTTGTSNTVTSCDDSAKALTVNWNSTAGSTNSLPHGGSARGDVTVNGIPYYDSGIGEGTLIVNLSCKPLTVYGQWWSGYVASTDVNTLMALDFANGCGDPKNGCKTERVVTFTASGEIIQRTYNHP